MIRSKLKFNELSDLFYSWLLNVKDKIVNFDIKPAEPVIPGLLTEADALIESDKHAEAEKVLNKVLEINNVNLPALKKLINLNLRNGNWQKTIYLLKRAQKIDIASYNLKCLLGYTYGIQGNLRACAKYYKEALLLKPDCEKSQHFVDAASKKNTAIAPRQYIINLFNDYAETFEKSLVEELDYQAHIKLANYMRTLISNKTVIENVIDLGCGTGLLGQELTKNFVINNLIGVDLSPNMLEISKVKNIYQGLHNMDLIEYLRMTQPGIDLIVSSDVLIYIGDLSPVMQESYRCLKPDGFFCFSIENLDRDNYSLSVTGRYLHSLAYLKSLCKQHNFSKMYTQPVELRKQFGDVVTGHLILLQK